MSKKGESTYSIVFTKDMAFVHQILKESSGVDNLPQPNEEFIWLKAKVNEETIGVYCLRSMTPQCVILNVDLLKDKRRGHSKNLHLKFYEWADKFLPEQVNTIVTYVPRTKHNIIDFLKSLGMENTGYITQAVVDDGVKTDLCTMCIPRDKLRCF